MYHGSLIFQITSNIETSLWFNIEIWLCPKATIYCSERRISTQISSQLVPKILCISIPATVRDSPATEAEVTPKDTV